MAPEPGEVTQMMADLRERAARRAYGRIYEGLAWEDASTVGRSEAVDAMTAEDVLAVVETNLLLAAGVPAQCEVQWPTREGDYHRAGDHYCNREPGHCGRHRCPCTATQSGRDARPTPGR